MERTQEQMDVAERALLAEPSMANAVRKYDTEEAAVEAVRRVWAAGTWFADAMRDGVKGLHSQAFDGSSVAMVGAILLGGKAKSTVVKAARESLGITKVR